MSVNTGKPDEFLTLSSYPKAIAHVDCDAFFASVEAAIDPSLKGKPVVTGKERGIIACASYEAKALGIKRGVSLWDAKRMCPGLIVLPSDYETYSIYSDRMFSIMRRFTPDVEEYSIDEAFCDLTGLRRMYRASYPDIARMMKDEIQKELGITVSIGLSLTKTLAKICSKHRKPDGFMPLPGRKIHILLKDTELERVCGFGPSTVALLTKFGIRNVLDFVKRPVGFADKLLGKPGRELWHELRGTQVYKISTEKKEKYLSISKSKTFSPPSKERDLVKAHLMRNLESAFIKLRRHGLSAKSLTVYLRLQDYGHDGLAADLDRHSGSTLDFIEIASRLFDMVYREGVMYRATGVVLTDIVVRGVDSRTLFDDPVKIENIANISKAVDKINQAYGKYAVHLASTDLALTDKRTHPRKDQPWRKTTLLKGESFRTRINIPLLRLGPTPNTKNNSRRRGNP